MLNMEDNQVITRFLKNSISCHFINKLEEFNAIFGQQQIENIHNTILLINNKNKINKIDNYLIRKTIKINSFLLNL